LSSHNFYAILASPDSGHTLQNLIDNNSTQDSLGFPVSLKIPKINVDSTFEYVGLTADGSMETPKDSANVAWFEELLNILLKKK